MESDEFFPKEVTLPEIDLPEPFAPQSLWKSNMDSMDSTASSPKKRTKFEVIDASIKLKSLTIEFETMRTLSAKRTSSFCKRTPKIFHYPKKNKKKTVLRLQAVYTCKTY